MKLKTLYYELDYKMNLKKAVGFNKNKIIDTYLSLFMVTLKYLKITFCIENILIASEVNLEKLPPGVSVHVEWTQLLTMTSKS